MKEEDIELYYPIEDEFGEMSLLSDWKPDQKEKLKNLARYKLFGKEIINLTPSVPGEVLVAGIDMKDKETVINFLTEGYEQHLYTIVYDSNPENSKKFCLAVDPDNIVKAELRLTSAAEFEIGEDELVCPIRIVRKGSTDFGVVLAKEIPTSEAKEEDISYRRKYYSIEDMIIPSVHSTNIRESIERRINLKQLRDLQYELELLKSLVGKNPELEKRMMELEVMINTQKAGVSSEELGNLNKKIMDEINALKKAPIERGIKYGWFQYHAQEYVKYADGTKDWGRKVGWGDKLEEKTSVIRKKLSRKGGN